MSKIKNIIKEVRNIFLVTLLLVGLFIEGLMISYNLVSGQSSPDDRQYKIIGWAWSSNIGWILFGTTSGNYWVRTTGTGAGEKELTGYAWSSNIGWISFNKNDLDNCPNSSCIAKLNIQQGTISGWARALAASTSNLFENGGWTGWIKLNDSNYSLKLGESNDWNSCSSTPSFCGWAWGGGGSSPSSSVIGWIVNYNLTTSVITAPSVSYNLTVYIATGTGVVTSSPVDINFRGSSGESKTISIDETVNSVTIYASSTNGERDVRLSGDCSGSGNNGTASCNFIMDRDKTVNVFFGTTTPGTGGGFTLAISDFKVYTAYCSSTELWNSTSTFPVSDYTRTMASNYGLAPFSGNIANRNPNDFAADTNITKCPETDIRKPIDIGFKASCQEAGGSCPGNYTIEVTFNKTNSTTCSVGFQGLTFSSSTDYLRKTYTYTTITNSLPAGEIRINNFCFPSLVPGNTTSIDVKLSDDGGTASVSTTTELRIFNYECLAGFCRQYRYNSRAIGLDLDYCKYWERSACASGVTKIKRYDMAELIRRIILNIMSRIR